MARSWITLLLCLLAVSSTSFVRCEDDVVDEDYLEPDRALLVVRKHVSETRAVQGRNLTVAVSIYNAGQSSALSVEVVDSELPAAFKLVSGSLSATFERIPVGSNVTLEYIVVPTGAEGAQELLPAGVKYQAEMESDDYQVGRSNYAYVYVLTPSQQIVNHLLTTGSIITMGACTTPAHWRNLSIGVLLVAILLGGNWSYKKVTSAKQKWNREKNLKDFGLDSDDETSKKSSKKAKKDE